MQQTKKETLQSITHLANILTKTNALSTHSSHEMIDFKNSAQANKNITALLVDHLPKK